MQSGYTLIEGDIPEPEIVEEGRLAAFKREFAERQKQDARDGFPERAERLETLTRPAPPPKSPTKGVATPKITFRVDEDEYEALKVIAEAEGKAIPTFARDAVRAYIYSR